MRGACARQVSGPVDAPLLPFPHEQPDWPGLRPAVAGAVGLACPGSDARSGRSWHVAHRDRGARAHPRDRCRGLRVRRTLGLGPPPGKPGGPVGGASAPRGRGRVCRGGTHLPGRRRQPPLDRGAGVASRAGPVGPVGLGRARQAAERREDLPGRDPRAPGTVVPPDRPAPAAHAGDRAHQIEVEERRSRGLGGLDQRVPAGAFRRRPPVDRRPDAPARRAGCGAAGRPATHRRGGDGAAGRSAVRGAARPVLRFGHDPPRGPGSGLGSRRQRPGPECGQGCTQETFPRSGCASATLGIS
jgi:hypothetical protein